jgi:hypothetical protein
VTGNLYSTSFVVTATGLTFRQLDYWARRTKSIFPTEDADGSGYARRWSVDDIARLTTIANVIRGFAELDIRQIPAGLVHRIWLASDNDETVIRSGAITIDLQWVGSE